MGPIQGFGYSFSNIGENMNEKNGEPYVAVGAVNIIDEGSEDSSVILLTSALLCIGLKEDCKSHGDANTYLLQHPSKSSTKKQG